MAGLCLGSMAGPRFMPNKWLPLHSWAALEFGIGLLGLVVLIALPYAARVHVGSGQGLGGMLIRAALAGSLLLPSTVLMGATLPVAARCVEATTEGISFLGLFYAANIGGAVFGCLLAGFYLLRLHDMPTASWVAAAMNGAIGCGALALARMHKLEEPAPVETPKPDSASAAQLPIVAVHMAIGISGFCALGAEVVWTRVLSLILGPTIYAFSLILAVFLAGLGIGSSAGAALARRVRNPGRALGLCQVSLTAAISWTAYSTCLSLPYWPINPSLSRSMWFTVQLDLLRCGWAIIAAPVLWGASFPLALAAARQPRVDPARLLGAVYAANTLGAILGALSCSLLLVPWVGTQGTERFLIALSALAGVLMLVAGFPAARCTGTPNRKPVVFGYSLQIAAVLLLSIFMASLIPAVPWQVVAYGRNLPTKVTCGSKLYAGEGRNAVVAVTQVEEMRLFHVSGKVEASSAPQDMRLQRMLSHLPGLLHPHPESVLVVGCGAGVTAGAFLLHPAVENIVICEIEPLIPEKVTPWFTPQNYGVLQDPRVKMHYEDGRYYIRTTDEKFDIITSDPIHPWVKGAATLFTKEYLQMCKQHLKPGGLLTQWLPLYDSNLPAVKCAVTTFMQVFPNGTIWSNCDFEEGYDVVLLGSADPMVIDVDAMLKRLAQADHQEVAQSLHEVGFKSAFSLLATYAGQGSDLHEWLRGAEVNLDRNLRLQYLAGSGINADDRTTIYLDLVRHRRYPEELFQSTSVWKQALKKAIGP